MKTKERINATKKLFRTLDDALNRMVHMEQRDLMITANVLRKVNEEIQDILIKAIQNERTDK